MVAMIDILTLAVIGSAPVFQAAGTEVPRELGTVRWGRELEPALEASKSSGKPVLLLFQEIPG